MTNHQDRADCWEKTEAAIVDSSRGREIKIGIGNSRAGDTRRLRTRHWSSRCETLCYLARMYKYIQRDVGIEKIRTKTRENSRGEEELVWPNDRSWKTSKLGRNLWRAAPRREIREGKYGNEIERLRNNITHANTRIYLRNMF